MPMRMVIIAIPMIILVKILLLNRRGLRDAASNQ